jgi:hypothetical protein
MAEGHRSLEDVCVAVVHGTGWIGTIDPKQLAQLMNEGLKIRPLVRGRTLPTRNEIADLDCHARLRSSPAVVLPTVASTF